MPKVAMNYQNTVIYKIVCKDLSITDCYVGSTTNFTKRKCQHKTVCNNTKCNGYNVNVYVFIRANGGWESWDMIEVEKFPCNDLNEALKRERYWIETLKATLNMVKPLRTKKEHYEDNKILILKREKEKYQQTRDVKLKYQKQYRIDNIDKILEYKKQYAKDNADKIKEHKKQYMKQYRLKKKKQLEEKTQSAEI